MLASCLNNALVLLELVHSGSFCYIYIAADLITRTVSTSPNGFLGQQGWGSAMIYTAWGVDLEDSTAEVVEAWFVDERPLDQTWRKL